MPGIIFRTGNRAEKRGDGGRCGSIYVVHCQIRIGISRSMNNMERQKVSECNQRPSIQAYTVFGVTELICIYRGSHKFPLECSQAVDENVKDESTEVSFIRRTRVAKAIKR